MRSFAFCSPAQRDAAGRKAGWPRGGKDAGRAAQGIPGQAVEADPGIGHHHHIGDGFGRDGMVRAFGQADHVAGHIEVDDIAAAIRHVAAESAPCRTGCDKSDRHCHPG